jgi:hypothetical protein
LTTSREHDLDESTGTAYSKVAPQEIYEMATARSKLVDVSVARWYHCVSRRVRKAFLLGEGDGSRKKWLENRLEELGQIFAVALGGFSLMDSHLHLLLRLDPAVAGT